MKKSLAILVALGVIVPLVLWNVATYVVYEGQQAVITQFGRPVRFVTDAGLYFKMPFIQQVHPLEKRLLPWDGDPENMQTIDKKRIYVNVWARWRIIDPKTFFSAVRTEQRGQKILDDLVDSAVRDVIARNKLIDAVRSSNEPLLYEFESEQRDSRSEASRDEVTTGRGEIEKEILRVAGDQLPERYGMELTDVHVKRVKYDDRVKETVYERMRSERERIARLFESEAEEAKQQIEGKTRKELDLIEGEMKQRADEVKGGADARVIQMTAEAYSRNAEFYDFLQRLELLKATLKSETRLVLSTDSDLLRLLTDAQGPDLPPPRPAKEEPSLSAAPSPAVNPPAETDTSQLQDRQDK